MNTAKLSVITGACVFLLLAFSASANAKEAEQLDSGISFESWLYESGRDIPVLSFDSTFEQGETDEDIQAENIIHDKDGSTRFQLSHRGPLSRQVFANVHSIAQEDGFTRNIITNIADGDQTEFLSRTADLAAFTEKHEVNNSSPLVRVEKTGDQDTECATCFIVVALGVACVLSLNRAYQQCRQACQSMGGIRNFDPGTCGVASLECTCWARPRTIAIEF